MGTAVAIAFSAVGGLKVAKVKENRFLVEVAIAFSAVGGSKDWAIPHLNIYYNCCDRLSSNGWIEGNRNALRNGKNRQEPPQEF
ncbi:hypothetical protein H6G00_12505 [Leptolyngbya sp. FACHB-541]|uniref:hypothetical protein n=1 Tax=Leptolyngbya sp. FACHB-541 TaxID=2692810 RepID=UPI0016830945|nr:hypothetical protein [Leptolyngbya sp. FACHB-541]MBD1997436.1 hypothetical protein [Leptolyngbya sp. FACHB-541]